MPSGDPDEAARLALAAIARGIERRNRSAHELAGDVELLDPQALHEGVQKFDLAFEAVIGQAEIRRSCRSRAGRRRAP
ncbi:MAG: hypothetical protein U1E63_07430 [Burkholderiales bacterium]